MNPKAMHPLAVFAFATAMFVTTTLAATASPDPHSKQGSGPSGAIPAENSFALADEPAKGTTDEKIVKSLPDSANKPGLMKSVDSTKYNMFGDLLNDDRMYNKKYPRWIPMVEVLGVHASLGLFNRFVSNADFARVGFSSWKHNITSGWEWDKDRFGMNFLAHPYSGGLNFMSARSNGYNFWDSVPFAVGGSLMWEYFGESTLPAYNDIVNTPISGAFYGEILYRLSSNILDDRTTGTERFFREFSAAIVSPTRFVNRLIQGRLKRVTTEEIYQKEPLNVELSLGMRSLNDGRDFGTGPRNLMMNTQLDYGYPMEKRDWKPFDFFKVRGGINMGTGRKIIETIAGYGVIYGKSVQSGKLETLMGIFQHYNYFDNKTFELGTIAFAGGIMSKYPLSKESYLFTNLHIGMVPLAGNSTQLGPDTSQVRDYNYGYGLETNLESGYNFGWGEFQFIGYYYWIHTYVGAAGDNYIGIIKPRITFRLVRNLNVGFEQWMYYTDRYTFKQGDFHAVRTEQRLYLMLNVGNFKL